MIGPVFQLFLDVDRPGTRRNVFYGMQLLGPENSKDITG